MSFTRTRSRSLDVIWTIVRFMGQSVHRQRFVSEMARMHMAILELTYAVQLSIQYNCIGTTSTTL